HCHVVRHFHQLQELGNSFEENSYLSHLNYLLKYISSRKIHRFNHNISSMLQNNLTLTIFPLCWCL
ncbi:hypothetical protein X975_03558, partial [Stegodyphus mimosarum]